MKYSVKKFASILEEIQNGATITETCRKYNTDDELRRLRKEIMDLKKENAILKKAAAYFAKNQK
ncbi:hypothetical protein DCCM_0307 [Desulfocucumis palustris]|uniref:Mobile element protein n=1 Tax=Desulfocucumis palustris TaxID=1898651 RepID=A0A2L2XD12_9FIRM|nr:hypothetical protein [Desulfocucumis palustris]GBF32116.1 hypothetical protein DCCM_0307 [Desulfocucumis palustris]